MLYSQLQQSWQPVFTESDWACHNYERGQDCRAFWKSSRSNTRNNVCPLVNLLCKVFDQCFERSDQGLLFMSWIIAFFESPEIRRLVAICTSADNGYLYCRQLNPMLFGTLSAQARCVIPISFLLIISAWSTGWQDWSCAHGKYRSIRCLILYKIRLR